MTQFAEILNMHGFVFVPGILMQLCSALFFYFDCHGYNVSYCKARIVVTLIGCVGVAVAVESDDAHVLLASLLVSALSFFFNGISAAIAMDVGTEHVQLKAPLLNAAV